MLFPPVDTQKGLLCFMPLSFGVVSVSALFQCCMEVIMQGW